MKLLFAVLYLGEQKLEATVQDDEGHRRRVTVSWMEQIRTDVPPAHWAESVAGEVDYQRSQEEDEKKGRKLPF
jgi:hypothetical protein